MQYFLELATIAAFVNGTHSHALNVIGFFQKWYNVTELTGVLSIKECDQDICIVAMIQ